ncbi:MAG: hypothetical protein OXN21_02005, partial [Chloroflexota bacterium]|nr:hypothetical protein [Chloroflexota bacterium]
FLLFGVFLGLVYLPDEARIHSILQNSSSASGIHSTQMKPCINCKVTGKQGQGVSASVQQVFHATGGGQVASGRERLVLEGRNGHTPPGVEPCLPSNLQLTLPGG